MRLIGDAYIAILPDATMFRPDLDAKIKSAMAGFKAKIPVTGDTSDIDKKIAAVAAALKGLNGQAAIEFQTKEAIADIAGLQLALSKLKDRAENIPLDMDNTKAIAKTYSVLAGINALSKQAESMRADFDINRALAKLYTMEAALKGLETTASEAMASKAAAIADAAKAFKDSSVIPGMGAKGSNPFGYGTLGMTGMSKDQAMYMDQLTQSTLNAMTAMEKLAMTETKDIVPASSLVVDALAAIGRGQSMIIAGNGGGWPGFLTTGIRLFGGALDNVLPKFMTSISVWHLGLDVILEFVAAWAPALIAVGTFAAVAGPIAEKIYGQWKNINTIINSTGGNLTDVGKGMDVLTKAIEPTVVTAFGEGLMAISTNAGGLGDALQKVGLVVDKWGAGIVQWAGSAAKGFSNLVTVGAGDFAAIGEGFHQLFRVIAELIKDVPGYVHILLSLGDSILKLTADVLQAAAPIVKFGLALHGAMVYIGLAVTAVIALGRAMAAGALASFATRTGLALTEAGAAAVESSGKFSKFGMAIGSFFGNIAGGLVNLKNWAGDVKAVGKESGVAAASSKILSDGVKLIPFGPAGVAALGFAAIIGGAIFLGEITKSKDVIGEFTDSIQKMVLASSTADIGANLQKGIQDTITKMTQVNAQMAAQVAYANRVKAAGLGGTGNVGFTNTSGATQGQVALQRLHDLQGQLIEQAGVYGNRMNALSSIFGSSAAAEAAMNLMGIKAGDIATENNKTFQTQYTELQGLAAGYGYMNQTGSTATAQLNALNIASGNATKNFQTLTQAEGQWVTMTTSGDSSFTSFAQGLNTLGQSLNSSGSKSVAFTDRLGNLRVTGNAAGASMNGITTASLNVRQAFDDQLKAGVTLYGNLQTLAGASGNTADAQAQLQKSGKDIIATLLPFAHGSKEATAELSSLAQLMGGPATDNFHTLANWVGNTKNAESDLNTEQTKLTISASNLTNAAKNLGNALETTVTNAQSAAVAQQSGLIPATEALANAIHQANGQVTKLAVTTSGQYITALLNSGISTQEAMNYLNAYLKQLGYTPNAIKQVDAAMGSYVASFTIGNNATSHAATNATNAKKAFVDFATNGLMLTDNQANALWQKFGQNNLDWTAGKANSTKKSFFDFAENGLKLTAEQAQNLWAVLVQQELDMAATKAGETKSQFVTLATALGDTTTQANNLWEALHKLPANTPVNIQASLSATGVVKANETIVGGETNLGELNFSSTAGKAMGGPIHGSGGTTSDNIPIMASHGEFMMQASAVKKYGLGTMNAMNNMRYASGGPINVSAMDASLGNLNPLRENATSSFAKTAVQDFEKALTAKQQAQLSAFSSGQTGYSPNGGVARWMPDILKALAMLGLPASLASAVEYQMQTESGGNPNIINNWDSNAAAGDPSRGLMQTIGSTFAAYHVPGTSNDIFDPLANIAAAINYAMHVYGPSLMSGGKGIGSGHGYAMGGPIMPLSLAVPKSSQGFRTRPHSAGGMLTEPVYGTGAYSGIPYSFAEGGPEYVGPISGAGAPGNGGIEGMNVHQGHAVVSTLATMVKLLQQMPYTFARGVSNGMGAGVRQGYWSGQGG